MKMSGWGSAAVRNYIRDRNDWPVDTILVTKQEKIRRKRAVIIAAVKQKIQGNSAC